MIKKLIKIILFAYGTVFSYLLFLSGIKNLRSGADLVLVLIVSPVTFYFLLTVFKQLKCFRGYRTPIDAVLQQLKIIGLTNTLLLFFLAVYGSIFSFEFVFILMILPLPLYFLLVNFGEQETSHQIVVDIVADCESVPLAKKTKKGRKIARQIKEVAVSEPLRRQFIKVVGGTSIGLLIASLINPRKAEAAFGSVPGPGTVALKDTNNVKIDPAIKSPTDAYGISQVDDATPSYYGFVNKDGAWYITCEEEDGSYRYCKGVIDFAYNWGRRGLLSYSYFNTAFAA